MKPILAIKIATSGISDNSKILGISLIYFDGSKPILKSPRLCLSFSYDDGIEWESEAHKMHSEWYKKILEGEQTTFKLVNFSKKDEISKLFTGFLSNLPKEEASVFLMGRNVERFSLKFLEKRGLDYLSHSSIHHNVIEYSSMFFQEYRDLLHPLTIFKRKGREMSLLQDSSPIAYCVNYLRTIEHLFEMR